MKRLAARAALAPMIKQDLRIYFTTEKFIDDAMRDAILALPAYLSVAVAGRPFAVPDQAIARQIQICGRWRLRELRADAPRQRDQRRIRKDDHSGHST